MDNFSGPPKGGAHLLNYWNVNQVMCLKITNQVAHKLTVMLKGNKHKPVDELGEVADLFRKYQGSSARLLSQDASRNSLNGLIEQS